MLVLKFSIKKLTIKGLPRRRRQQKRYRCIAIKEAYDENDKLSSTDIKHFLVTRWPYVSVSNSIIKHRNQMGMYLGMYVPGLTMSTAKPCK